MELVNQHAKESRLKYKIPNGQPLHQVWNSLWEQCEEANEIANSLKGCFPTANRSLANIMKMLEVFHSEVNKPSSRSVFKNEKTKNASDQELGESCGSSKSKQNLLEENYKRRGEIIEFLLSRHTTPLTVDESLTKQRFEKARGPKEYSVKGHVVTIGTEAPEIDDMTSSLFTSLATKGANIANISTEQSTSLASERANTECLSSVSFKNQDKEGTNGTNTYSATNTLETTAESCGKRLSKTESKENITKTLVKLLTNFTKYDPSKDPFTNMSVFEDECSQHNLGPRESCLMMKLWLPSNMTARLAAPVARPAGGPQFWSDDYHWGDSLDRIKALARLVTGEDHLGTDLLESLTVTSQDDPYEFARKYDKAFRLVMNVHDPKTPPALLKALVNKFNYVDRLTQVEASKEETVEGIARLVDSYQRDECRKSALKRNETKSVRENSTKDSIPKDEQPMRWMRNSYN